MPILWADLGPDARAQIEAKLGERGVRGVRKTRSRRDLEREDLEAAMLTQIKQVGLPDPVRQHRFHDDRQWRFDFAWPDYKFAVEVDGGTFSGGGHVRGKHYESDCHKGCEAVLAGWHVIHVTTDMVQKDGSAITYIERFFMSG